MMFYRRCESLGPVYDIENCAPNSSAMESCHHDVPAMYQVSMLDYGDYPRH